MTQRIMILSTNGFEQSELEEPKRRLEEAGYETVVVSPESGEIRGFSSGKWGDAVTVDLALEEAKAADFDALVLPGGQINPDILRMNEKAIALVRDFDAAGKPIAAICHAPWLLIEAGIVEGMTVTSWPSVRTDLRNAGGNVVDKEVAVDGNLITSRNPDDIPAFTDALIAQLREMADAGEMADA
ncbi:type 1 glutamine amidotransferase domain-containing protein [Erythrobacter sp. EC-HK427]|uniref:type 1 glutamine amidotransferase domain-containing protein n=1 Tax=Erythrobacter sp. EC-HK427 TaxID=2038396 RepID=UPI001252F86C|nr:type 1 glutamine amidotransferase domain-containing protein [Erythrobacter sp. EC-HK427]VVT19625.1 putative intracellular protease [Erythrobacter sp. EC-HK427]